MTSRTTVALLLAAGVAACGDGPSAPQPVPMPALSVGGVFTCQLDAQGQATCWGANLWGQLGDDTGAECDRNPCTPLPSPVAAGVQFRGLSASTASSIWSGHVCGITTGFTALCWGVDHTQLGQELQSPEYCVAVNGLVGQPCSRIPLEVPVPGRPVGIASGDFHTCALTSDGAVWCWGSDSNGQLGSQDDELCGLYDLPCSFAPVRVSSDLPFVQVVAGAIHTCALAVNGTAQCWGNNDRGQLAHEEVDGRNVPSQAAGGMGFLSLTAGRRHTCGLTRDGAVWCWGDNSGGQLGNGTTVPTALERRVPIAAKFVQVSAGWWHTCALAESGVAYCWGSNAFGQLGAAPPDPEACTEAQPCSTKPVAVAAPARFVSVGAGGAHTCAIGRDGATYCWGDNSLGQLGTGDGQGSGQPVRVRG